MDSLTSGGPLLLGALIAIGTFLKWPSWTNYIWAAIAILWGLYPMLG